MFTSLKRVTYLVADLPKARDWYCKLLNSQPVFDAPFAAIFAVADCALWLVPSPVAAGNSDERVIAWWGVEDIDDAYRRLLDLGATSRREMSTQADVLSASVVDPFGNAIGIVCKSKDPQKRSVENQPSESAYNVTLCRAMAAREDGDGVRGPDHLAEIFLSDDTRRILEDRASREHIKTMVTPELYGFLHARTVWLDGVFQRALDEGTPQIVFLGAGYDSRAFRFADRLGSTRVFELDAPSTQQRKLAQLQKAGMTIPPQLTFAATNFKSDSLEEVLTRSGFDARKRTLFIWEGVIYYLPAEAVSETLRFVASHSPAGSRLCFDYMPEARTAVYAGEPFLFFLEEDRTESFLKEHGFQIEEHSAPPEIARRYNTLPDGSSAGGVRLSINFVCARVVK